MGIELDPLDDIFADEMVQNARAVSKFQPKAKFRPARKDSAASVNSSRAVQISDAVETKSREPVSIANSSEHYNQSSSLASPLSEKDTTRDISRAPDNFGSNVDVEPRKNGGWNAHMEKSVGENADIFIGLEALGDFLPHTSTDIEDSVTPSEPVALDVPNLEKAGGLDIPGPSSFEDSNCSFNLVDGPPCTESSRDLDSLTCENPNVTGMDRREFENEETDVMDSLLVSDSTTVTGQRTGKFQPKAKIQREKESCEAAGKSACQSFATEAVPPQNDVVPPQNDVAERNSIPAFEHDDILDLSSIEFTHTTSPVADSDLPLNEESMNLMETTHLDSDMHLEGGPEIPAKLASRRAKAATSETHMAPTASSEQVNRCSSLQENELRRSLRPRKSKINLCEQVDMAEDEVLCSEEFTAEEDSEKFQEESESQMKRPKRKPRKSDASKEQPAEKRKKAGEASQNDAPPKLKKFSHSTRRRRVDKVLLETPEDEIDYQKVPLRDLILLAEHKERQTKKEASVAAPPTTQSNGTSQDHHNEEYNDGEGNPMVEETAAFFNYQTYMDKTPSTRWTKQETELFYEAIQQFGTDLSMIQHLFPGRNRNQLKLKYKKEERQHPLRLNEALSTRFKDHSHFETVIKRLQQIAAEEKQNAEKDESVDLTGNEEAEEGISPANEEEAKDEQRDDEDNEGEKNEDVDLSRDQNNIQSSFKLDEDEDDLFEWSQYESDV